MSVLVLICWFSVVRSLVVVRIVIVVQWLVVAAF
jgi:hypothetical protein